jgi:hypothetical protein
VNGVLVEIEGAQFWTWNQLQNRGRGGKLEARWLWC